MLRAAAADGGVGALLVRAGRGTRLSFFVAAAADRGRESGAVRAAGVSRLAVEVGDGASPEKWPSRRVSGLQVPFVAGKATAQALAGWQAGKRRATAGRRAAPSCTRRGRVLSVSLLSRAAAAVCLTLSRAARRSPHCARCDAINTPAAQARASNLRPSRPQGPPLAALTSRKPPVTTTSIHTTRTTPKRCPPPCPLPPQPAQPSSTESAKGPPRPLLHGGEPLVALPHLSCVSASRPLPFPLQGSSTRCRHHRA